MNPLGLLAAVYTYLRCSGDPKNQTTADNMDDLAGGCWGCLESAWLTLCIGAFVIGMIAWGPVGWLILVAIGVLVWRSSKSGE
jgi:hypothetical protein